MIGLYAAQVRAAIRASLSDRGAFTLQVGGMVLNDLVFLVMWWMFFAGFHSVGGWTRPDMALLMGLMMTLVGVMGVFAGGYRDMAATILNGELDGLLTQPTGLISRLLARESLAGAWGDLAGGAVLLIWFSGLSMSDLPWTLIALLVGGAVYLSASIAFASLAFWASGARSFSRELMDFTLLFSTYPGTIYQGAVKVIAFTLLPAGFIVLTPASLIRSPGPEALAVVILAAGGYAGAALGLFHLGLRRYRRGERLAG